MAATKARGEAFLPVGPLVKMIDRMTFREQRSEKAVCRNLGFDSATLKKWRSGEQEFVSEWMADRVLTGTPYCLWDLWPADVFPEIAARLGYGLVAA